MLAPNRPKLRRGLLFPTLRVLAVIAATMLVGALPAQAAVFSETQDWSAGGDFALGEAFSDNYPAPFDTGLGTLRAVQFLLRGSISWAVPVNGEAAGRATLYGRATIFTPFDEIETPIVYQRFAYFDAGIEATQRFRATDWLTPADYTAFMVSGIPDGAFAGDYFVNLTAFGLCHGCDGVNIDDAGGFGSGTLTTRFFYTPAHRVPEPSSLAALAGGLALLAGCAGRHRLGIGTAAHKLQ